MGVVYAARHIERGEVVALKTLRWTDPTAIYRLKKEFRVLADVAHPNLVTLYELLAHEDAWFFTMELVDGVPLDEYVRAQPPDIGRVRGVLRQMAEGLSAIHAAGLLHRDLKPSNVLVASSGRRGLNGARTLPAAGRTSEHLSPVADGSASAQGVATIWAKASRYW